MAASYIPTRDADYANWLDNFATLLVADPTAYGETEGTVAPVVAENSAFQVAYTLAIDPSTRTPATVAAKDAARVTSSATARVVAQRINANPSVTNQQRTDLGLTVRKTDRTPIPPPVVAPGLALDAATPGLHIVRYSNPDAPDGKAKPFGSTGVEMFRVIAAVPAVDPAQASYLATVTKAPSRIATPVESIGQLATYFARFTTRSGPDGIAQPGPWSLPLTVAIV